MVSMSLFPGDSMAGMVGHEAEDGQVTGWGGCFCHWRGLSREALTLRALREGLGCGVLAPRLCSGATCFARWELRQKTKLSGQETSVWDDVDCRVCGWGGEIELRTVNEGFLWEGTTLLNLYP